MSHDKSSSPVTKNHTKEIKRLNTHCDFIFITPGSEFVSIHFILLMVKFENATFVQIIFIKLTEVHINPIKN